MPTTGWSTRWVAEESGPRRMDRILLSCHDIVVPAHKHAQVFRQELGFGYGMTLSDCNDINVLMDYRIAANVSQASAKGLIGEWSVSIRR